MLLIFISWIYISFVSITLGCAFLKLLKIQTSNIAVTALYGFFATALFTTFWAVFSNIGSLFHICLLGLSVLSAGFYKSDIITVASNFTTGVKQLPGMLKAVLLLNSILILAQCAAIPYVIDNESYYIQTVKWLNEYGLVKGIGNLHFFLAQTSGWHITQSAFSFSFLYSRFNDISGYCLLLGNIFCIIKLNDYFKNNTFYSLVTGLLPVAGVLLFQFISAPSPDVPVYVISFIIFWYYLNSSPKTYIRDFKLISILLMYLVFIKTTAVVLLVVPIALLFKNYRGVLQNIFPVLITGLLTLAAFIIKNTITSGYPLFPVINFTYDCDWIIPEKIANLYYNETKVYGYLVKKQVYDAMSYKQLFIRWLTLPKLHGLFNVIGAGLIIITPTIIYRLKNEKKWWVLYALMVLQMIVLFVSSPQYRFFMNTLLLFSFFIAALVFRSKKSIGFLLAGGILASAIILFVPINLNKFAHNKFALETSTFKINEMLIPHSNTKYSTGFEKVTEGNLIFWSPLNNRFLWVSGNGPVPCLNKRQLNRFKKKYRIIPQMRTNSLKDGFYSKEITSIIE